MPKIIVLFLSTVILHLVTSLPFLLASTQVGFYDSSCPDVESIVGSTIEAHVKSDVTIAAGLLRLHFHDCFIQGCDGSVLIDGPSSEKTAPANLGLRGFEAIDDAKSRLEEVCPGVVSCADILALAARDAVDLSGGPSWSVPLGRRDGRVSVASDASNMPAPTDSVSVLNQKFAAKGLSTQDLVILNGAHTIGQTDCRFFSYRLYNYSKSPTESSDPTMDREYLSTMQGLCPANGDGLNKVALDTGSQTRFDISFFKNLLRGYGVLESDQKLAIDSSTQSYVRTYAGLITGFLGFRYDIAFTKSMIKMSNIDVKIAPQGEVRRACSSFN